VRSAYVVGSGPNGLAAAIVLARAGMTVTVLEEQPSIGGGTRSTELTLPGFTQDVCSAVHPLAISSPLFRQLPLDRHGLQWIHSRFAIAHPLDDGSSTVLERSVEETAKRWGVDGNAWRRVVGGLVRDWDDLLVDILGPVGIPRRPVLLARFGAVAAWPASLIARALFRTEAARALFAGIAGHSTLPLEHPLSGAFGWVLALAGHGGGWPIPRRGSQSIANALASYLSSIGGRVLVNTPVRSLDELRDSELVLCDITPLQLLQIAGERLPKRYRRALHSFRYGPGVFKMDWALSAPIPWRSEDCSQAATVHLGGSLSEIEASERTVASGGIPARPFVLLAQPSLFDDTRAPAGQHTAWAYCHVPNGSETDVSDRIEAQVERFAPGFRRLILARSTMTTIDMQRRNSNLQGGDINGGAIQLGQVFFRPTRQLYRTPIRGLYLCSSSTPPGGGVHGMCGYHAARCALADLEIPHLPL
jgi:phytoene dehydrogenase-like protein